MLSAFELIDIYVSRTRYYLVGHNNAEQRLVPGGELGEEDSRVAGPGEQGMLFNMLAIDRTCPLSLRIEDWGAMTKAQASERVAGLRQAHSRTGGLQYRGRIAAVLGVLALPRLYLLVARTAEQTGTIQGHSMWTVTESLLLPVCHDSLLPLSADFTDTSPRYLQTVAGLDLGKERDYFFSRTLDLTRTLQARLSPHPPATHDERFTWNLHMTRLFLQAAPSASAFLTALVHGSCSQVPLASGELLTLLARRSRHMAGTRYLRRGLSRDGDVANEVESELLLESPQSGLMASCVLHRGSIPLFWSQLPDASKALDLSPETILDHSKNKDNGALVTHFEGLRRRYGDVTVLNLIRQKDKAKEQRLGVAFALTMGTLNSLWPGSSTEVEPYSVPYHAYDFLANAKTAPDDIRKLIWEDVSRMGVCVAHVGGVAVPEVLQRQTGVVRINCIDCLDRTNVAQHSLARMVLGTMLTAVRASPETVARSADVLKRLFEQHGDRIAQQYAGSGAMHKDRLNSGTEEEEEEGDGGDDGDGDRTGRGEQTRRMGKEVGKRGLAAFRMGLGHAHNAFSATKRMVKQNLFDQEKQQAMDLFLGLYIPAFESTTSSSSSSASSLPSSSSSSRGSLSASASSTALPTLSSPLPSPSPSAPLRTSASNDSFLSSFQSSSSSFHPTPHTDTVIDTVGDDPFPPDLADSFGDFSIMTPVSTAVKTATVGIMNHDLLSPSPTYPDASPSSSPSPSPHNASAAPRPRAPLWELEAALVSSDTDLAFGRSPLAYSQLPAESVNPTSASHMEQSSRRLSEFDSYMTAAELEAKDTSAADTLRTDNPRVIFTIASSHDKNLIVYEANLSRLGVLNPKTPVTVYRLKQGAGASPNTKEHPRINCIPLGLIEKNFTFGVKVLPADTPPEGGRPRIKLSLACLPSRPFYLEHSGAGGATHAVMVVQGVSCRLKQLFLSMAPRNFASPKIELVFVTGEVEGTGEVLEERIKLDVLGALKDSSKSVFKSLTGTPFSGLRKKS